MKKLAIGLGIVALSTTAMAEDARVVGIEPVFGQTVQWEEVPVTKQVCEGLPKHKSDGLLEKGVDAGFGSTGGLIGTAAGVAIIDEFGGNDAAKIIGGLLGNRIGNDISEQKRRNRAEIECYQVETFERQRYYAKTITGYKVDVEIGDSVYTVRRKKEPYIGQYIPVRVSVQ